MRLDRRRLSAAIALLGVSALLYAVDLGSDTFSLSGFGTLGAQLDGKISNKWSASVQVVSEYSYDGDYTPNWDLRLALKLLLAFPRIKRPVRLVQL